MGVTFDYSAFIARYPEFATTVPNTGVGQLFFNEATLYCDNSDTSVVIDLTVRAMLLNMLTAHIAQMNVGSSIQPVTSLTGRISQATEGSVSVTTENMNLPGTAAWYSQTKYGLAFWQAALPYRSGLYIPGCPRNEDPYGSLIFR